MEVDEVDTGEMDGFIDDTNMSVRSSQSGYRGPASDLFEGDGARASYDGGDPDDKKAKKRVRSAIRKLDPMSEIGLLRDYIRRLPRFLSTLRSVCNEPAPYTWYCNLEHPHDTADVHVQSSVFLTPSQASYLNDPSKLHSLAVKFADYGDQTHHTKEQPLRRIDALMQFAESDPFNYPRVSPVCEMICANNIVNPRNEIDRQPCDSIRGELVAKGDPYTQQHLRDGYARGGPPGLPSVVLWRVKDGTSVVDVDNTVLRLWKYWNIGISRPELLGDHKLDVQNPFTEFYYDGKKRFKNARVCIESMGHDTDLDAEAISRHVHPAIMAKLNEPHVHPCREPPHSSTSEATDTIISSRFSCCVHVIPHQVRDYMGKTRNVIVSVLRIRSTVPGCDPIVALRCLTALPGFSQDLIKITQHMMCCLNFSGGSSIDQLFDTTLRNNKHNLASIGHEANLGLGFFGYLKNNYILTRRSSVQSACYDQKFRINIFDKGEVAELMEFLEIAHFSRKQYYAQVVLHSCHDMANARSAALPLPSSGEGGVDWRQFFPGMHWKAIRKDALRREYGRDAIDSQYDGDFEEFLGLQPDPDYVFVQCDGASFKSGYVIFCQSKIRSEDSPDMLKMQAQLALKEGSDNILVTDMQEVSPVHFCSKRFELFCNYYLSPTDPYSMFLDPALPNVPHIDVLRRDEKSLTLSERTLLGYMTDAPDDGVRLDRGQIKTAMIETAYGLRGCPLHAQLSSIDASCQCVTLLEQTVHAIRTKVKEYLHFGSNCTMGQLNQGARFVLDLARVDADPPRARCGQSIAGQHLAVHAKVAAGIPNDDAQVARCEVENFCQFKSELNSVNASILRLLLCAHPSLWSCTNDGAYGYCFQICDGGNSFRVQLIKGGKPSEDFVEFDLKSPGSGADMLWNIFGELVNAFPKFMSLVHSMREFFTANAFCELWQQKSHMAFKRTNGIAKNIRGTVVDSLSEHNKNFGQVGAMLELNKQEQSKEKVDSVWPNIEAGVGQSGVTENGVKQTPYCTTISGVVINVNTLHPLQLLLLASNLISVSRPPSVNDGGRVNPVTAGSCDSLGRIVHQPGGCATQALELIVMPSTPMQQARPRDLRTFTSDITESNDPLPVDDKIVSRQMAMFLLEYMARIFSLVHRGLCFKRRVNLGWGSFNWRHIKECCMHITTNMRKPTYTADDKMARHMNGTLETLLYGKWVRCILGMVMHRRLTLTEGAGRDQRTQLRHVLPDALVMMALVPVTVATVLSALQLYLSMVVLDVGVMVVSCMVLYYNRLPQNCPMHVMALVIRGESGSLSDTETLQYHSFAQYLHGLLMTSLVPQSRVATSISGFDALRLFSNNADAHLIDHVTASPEASCYVNGLFFGDGTILNRDVVKGMTTVEIFAHVFAAQQCTSLPATTFWSTAVPAVRLPMPTNKVNERNHQKFNPPHQSAFFYTDVYAKLCSMYCQKTHFGAVVNFLRTCGLRSDVSRYDLVMALLSPWASAVGVDLQSLKRALHITGALAEDWARPIFNSRQCIDATMLQFAVNLEFGLNGWEYVAKVGLASDVLWLLVSQALYAVRWESTPQQRVAVIHTSNMSHAAQGLVYLFMHTSVPKSAVPACVGGRVLLTEPSLDPVDAGQALGIPYRAVLHVDVGFLNAAMREPRHMQVVSTAANGLVLLSKRVQMLDHEKGDLGTDVIQDYDICPYPPESVAHMLPVVPSLMRAFRSMHRQFPELDEYAGSKWALAVRLFAATADAQSLMHIPVALTEHALDEELPCVTFEHGMCFVLCIRGGMVDVRPVALSQRLPQYSDDTTLLKYSTFQALPLSQDQVELSFPAELLSYAMTSGLSLCNGVAKFRPPDVLTESQADIEMHPVPFAFMPIIRFQALLLLELLEETDDVRWYFPNCRRTYPETAEATLTVAVLNTHPGSTQFLRNGHYHVQYRGADKAVCSAELDYIFTSQCLLRDGRQVFCTFTAAEYTHMLDTVAHNRQNDHVKGQTFALERTVPTRDGFTLECFYTLSDQPRRDSLADVMVQIAFVVKQQTKEHDVGKIMYFEVNLFDRNNKSRLHIIRPEEPSEVVPHFYWQGDF